MRRVEREETWGEISPHHLTMGLGKHRKLPHGARAEARLKIDLCIFQVRKKPSGTRFSVFLSDAGPPKRLGA